MSEMPAATRLARALVDALHAAGIRHVCVCPGARSGPVVFALDAHGDFSTSIHLDERAGAFYALGMARAQAAPVALLCTSGSAVAHFAPAVVEAAAAGVPLVVLTGDRPPELHDRGAPQTMDQQRFFGEHARAFLSLDEAELADGGAGLHRRIERLVRAAVGVPAGPVHANLIFREPLGDGFAAHAPPRPATVRLSPRGLRDEGLEGGLDADVAHRLRSARRPLLIVGTEPGPHALGAEALSTLLAAWPVPALVDATSGARSLESTEGALVRSPTLALPLVTGRRAWRPDLIVRLGGMLPSRAFLGFVDDVRDVPHLLFDRDDRWLDPVGVRAQHVALAPRRAARAIMAALQAPNASGPGRPTSRGAVDPRWTAAWRVLDTCIEGALEPALPAPIPEAPAAPSSDAASPASAPDALAAPSPNPAPEAPTATAPDAASTSSEIRVTVPEEGRVARAVAASLAPDDLLHVASSMPIRDVDAWALRIPAHVVTANRGTNGIDGTVSTALGALAAHRVRAPHARAVVLLGDVAMIHDLNALVATPTDDLPITVVVINNDGGAIFSFLPFASDDPRHARYFRTRHGHRFEGIAQMAGASYVRVDVDALPAALAEAREVAGPAIIEVVTDGERHRDGWRRAQRELPERTAPVVRSLGPPTRGAVEERGLAEGGRMWTRRGGAEPIDAIALHGLTGRGSDWLGVARALDARTWVAVDLPGHGGAAPPPDPSSPSGSERPSLDGWDAISPLATRIDAARAGLAEPPAPTLLVGYSMGARLGLAYALRAPGSFAGVVLIGGRLGIDDAGEAAARAASDDALAAAWTEGALADHLDAWRSQPLLHLGGPIPAWAESVAEERTHHDAAGLAQALRAWSTGRMPCLATPLAAAHDAGQLPPLLLVVGSRDRAYLEHARAIVEVVPTARLVVVPGAGHAVHREDPDAVASAIHAWWRDLHRAPSTPLAR